MSVRHALLSRRLRIACVRAHQSIGWPGWAGILLSLFALILLGLGWRVPVDSNPADREGAIQFDRISKVASAASGSPPTTGSLPRHDEIPQLLLQIQQAAVSSGLGWPAADYRITPASSLPAMLEVRCNLKGPYPKLRQMLTQLLKTVPTLTLREVSLSRPSSASVDVDAKLVIAVFIEDLSGTSAVLLEGGR